MSRSHFVLWLFRLLAGLSVYSLASCGGGPSEPGKTPGAARPFATGVATTAQIYPLGHQGSAPRINDAGDIVFNWSSDFIRVLPRGAVDLVSVPFGYGYAPSRNDNGDTVWQQEIDNCWFSTPCPANQIQRLLDGDTFPEQLTFGSIDNYRPDINDQGDIVWQAGWSIAYLAAGSTNPVTIGASAPGATVSPSINDNGDVVFIVTTSEGRKVFLLAAGETDPVAISDGSGVKLRPDINNWGDVVWVDTDGSDTEIFLLPAGATEPVQITDNDSDDHRPSINDDGDIVWSGDWPFPKLFLYTTKTRASAEIVSVSGTPDPGQVLTVQGAGSDPEGDALTFVWKLFAPYLSSAAIEPDPTDPSVATFEIDRVGTYYVDLYVTDGSLASERARITVTVADDPPVADAGGETEAVVGDTVTLDGGGSSDPEGQPLTYAWILAPPADSTAVLTDSATVTPSFYADVPGIYLVSLEVSDGVNVATDQASVQVLTAEDATVQTLEDTVETIAALPEVNAEGETVLQNPNLGNALTNKINAVLAMIDAGDYDKALNKLQSDLIRKTDGCAVSGAPDSNDWIETCPEQAVVYGFLSDTIDYLNRLLGS